ncbi:hypothetical protein MAR_ORF378 [Marseillevirus marseillevirus]|uniref:Uncharacterized protein n=1 Tax=Marseillevirus marseillevirus TaxID=694581 RepID=D2XB14_GBMV|nr:hypothetical protein MAR_ORF378 [Marseillevirus marseillevirus]ADB04141.1 hypothetical protein MAR_ORF378 [Marseillevirus marseillevirus]AVR53095.1 hypothetical protein MarSH_390 [Marseillevirus Shanghai 1]
MQRQKGKDGSETNPLPFGEIQRFFLSVRGMERKSFLGRQRVDILEKENKNLKRKLQNKKRELEDLQLFVRKILGTLEETKELPLDQEPDIVQTFLKKYG